MTIMIVWRLWIWPNRRWRHLKTNDMTKKPIQSGPTTATSLLTNAAYNERKIRENGSNNSGSNNHFSAEKRGVTRITLITCFIQASL